MSLLLTLPVGGAANVVFDMSPDDFARHQFRDYVIYQELARSERVPEFRVILEKLTAQEFADYEFWRGYASREEYRVRLIEIWFYKILRRFLGLTFTAKFLEGKEHAMIARYERYIADVADLRARARMEEILARERAHEAYFISQVKEDRVAFLSNIVLGLNDGLIELTGALAGFTFAIGSARGAGFAGLITGCAAALSMAASAYLQAQYESGRDARTAALYTGVSYFIVVCVLIAPFFLFSGALAAFLTSLAAALGVITLVAFYTSVLFDRMFSVEWRRMLLFSIGVACVTVAVGLLARPFIGGIF